MKLAGLTYKIAKRSQCHIPVLALLPQALRRHPSSQMQADSYDPLLYQEMNHHDREYIDIIHTCAPSEAFQFVVRNQDSMLQAIRESAQA